MWLYSLPALFWSVVVTVLCLLPGKDLPEVQVVNFDKFVHITVFGLLCWLYLRWLMRKKTHSLSGQILVVLAVIVYGGLMEVLQGAFYTDRSADWLDFAANSAGCIIAFFVPKRQ